MNEQSEKLTEQTENETLSAAIEEDENTEPDEPMTFGMPSFCFRGAALGVAMGYILSGIIGLVLERTVSANVCAIAGAVIGYFIAKAIRKKRQAQQKIEE